MHSILLLAISLKYCDKTFILYNQSETTDKTCIVYFANYEQYMRHIEFGMIPIEQMEPILSIKPEFKVEVNK